MKTGSPRTQDRKIVFLQNPLFSCQGYRRLSDQQGTGDENDAKQN